MEIHVAVTDEEKDAVYRSRAQASTARQPARPARLVDLEDESSWSIYVAGSGGEVEGSFRITRGSDGFSLRQVERYGLEPFLAELPPRALAVVERIVVPPTERGKEIGWLLAGVRQLPGCDGILVVFGACSHRPSGGLPFPCVYRRVAADDAASRVLFQVVAFPRGPEALAGMGRRPGLPACVAGVLLGDAAAAGLVRPPTPSA